MPDFGEDRVEYGFACHSVWTSGYSNSRVEYEFSVMVWDEEKRGGEERTYRDMTPKVTGTGTKVFPMNDSPTSAGFRGS